MAVLVTGGTGYIGSHTVVELLNRGEEVIIVDSLANSKIQVLERIKKITGKDVKFYKFDLCDKEKVDELFKKEKFESIIHFAGLKAVGESCAKPILYYQNNLISSLNLLDAMVKYGVNNIIFSSSATVYGTKECKDNGFTETDEVGGTTNPYGTTKYFIERIMMDAQKANPQLNVVLLRYFNPIGAHESGLLGEDPNGIPNNLMPYVTQVAIGKLDHLNVFGNDYNTKDGTGVRDYIHVVDLALGHVAALAKIRENCGLEIYNLGTGNGVSVLNLVNAFEKANNIKIPYVIAARRPGDIATSFANAKKAKEELGWTAKLNIEDCCKDSWNFQKNNPQGIR